MELSKEELKRYSRQILIPEFGLAGQRKIKESAVLVIGCGGLGSPVLMYLAAAGVGKIGLVENDTVEESNLQRQILFTENSLGNSKIKAAEEKLKAINSFITIEQFPVRFSAANALEIIKNYDLVIDGSDNFPTRYLVNDACVLTGKPFVSGAIYRFEGQVSVFNYKGGVTYRDLFPSPPSEEMAPNCAKAGILGMMAGIIGSIQATEAIKLLTGIGEPISGKLLLVDALGMNFRKIKISKNLDLKTITELVDYEAFCSLQSTADKSLRSPLMEVTFESFKKLNTEKRQLIDVREQNEYDLENLGGELMPLSELERHWPKIKQDGTVVIHCQSGVRSQKAIEYLQKNHGFKNLLNLKGGLNAIDS